jgi:catecholate siderophore receptor
VLSGQRHAAGLEVDLAGRITPDWEIYLSLAWIPSARIDKGASTVQAALQGEVEGQRPGLTPRHSGTVWGTWRVTPTLRVGAGLNARSSDSPQRSAVVAPGFVSYDAMAEYSAGDVIFKLNVTNLANKRFADTLYRGHYLAGKPRTVQLTTSVRF